MTKNVNLDKGQEESCTGRGLDHIAFRGQYSHPRWLGGDRRCDGKKG